jgi:outer membrane protein OmpA-like peptidoglycan-associated protein
MAIKCGKGLRLARWAVQPRVLPSVPLRAMRREGQCGAAAVGAAVGTTTGVVLDTQEERLRKAGIRAQRDENGRLLVNLSGAALQFDTGQSTLKPQGIDQLNKIAAILKAYPENRITIAGHTDSIGSNSANLVLSQARADRVKTHLIHQGVSDRCIVAANGYGESFPIAGNETTAGRERNRRVELQISVDPAEAEQNQLEREHYSRAAH